MKINKLRSAKGIITIPGDKSVSHRAVMLGALAQGKTTVFGFLPGADCLSTIDCFRSMGIDIKNENNVISVFGKGLHGLQKPEKLLYTGNSGTTTRLLCGILSGQPFSSKITGDASICKRPMDRVTKPLSLMGAHIKGTFCPLEITGSSLHGIDYKMPVASAQVKTALILAGLYAEGQTVIHELVQSRNHTELMLGAMGCDLKVSGNDITLNPGNELSAQEINVPGDISSAAFWLVLGAVLPNSEITVKNVGMNPTRTGIIDILSEMGAKLSIENKRISGGEMSADITVYSSSLHGVTVCGEMIPRLIDEIPVIAVAAAAAEGTTVIKDAQELKVKESNRIRAVTDEFKKCGINITETDDGMIINGGSSFRGADFVTHGDHRMAMSFAVLAQLADGDSSIDDDACVNVSYPHFFDTFNSLNG